MVPKERGMFTKLGGWGLGIGGRREVDKHRVQNHARRRPGETSKVSGNPLSVVLAKAHCCPRKSLPSSSRRRGPLNNGQYYRHFQRKRGPRLREDDGEIRGRESGADPGPDTKLSPISGCLSEPMMCLDRAWWAWTGNYAIKVTVVYCRTKPMLGSSRQRQAQWSILPESFDCELDLGADVHLLRNPITSRSL